MGKAISILKKYKCKKIIFAGKVFTPNFTNTKFDFKALYYLPRIIKEAKKGDASIIKIIINIFKKEGFKIISSTFLIQNCYSKEETIQKSSLIFLAKRIC